MSESASKTNTPSWQPTATHKSDSHITPRPFPMPVNNMPQVQAKEDLEGYRKPKNGDMMDNVGSLQPTGNSTPSTEDTATSGGQLIAPSPPTLGVNIQPKLTIGEPGDRYEQEADQVADQVVQRINTSASPLSSQSPSVQRQDVAEEEIQTKPSISVIQRSIFPLQAHREGMSSEELQTKSILQRQNVQEGRETSTDVESAINSARGGGMRLDAGLQRSMGQAMGADFSGVRIHTDTQADQLNRSIQAKAFTTGQDVFFRTGEYNPMSRGGQELIAHELTHVVQQKQELKIQRDLLDDFVLGARNFYHNVAEGVGLESHDEAEAARLQAFIDHGIFGPESLVPPTNIGGFDASFDPASGVLLIEVGTGVNFQNGLSIDASNVITANHTDLNQAAIDGMNLAPADRAAFVADFTWTDDQKQNFLTQLEARVEGAWGGKYIFSCTRPGWESLMANVVVDVNVHEGTVEATEHLQTTTYKVPDSGTYNVGAFVGSGNDQNAHNNRLVMSSTHVNPTPIDRSLLRKTVFFDNNSAVLTARAQTTLSQFAADFQDANLDLTNPVTLEGHASSPGSTEHNNKLAQARIDAVRNQLSTLGFTGINDRVSTRNMGETDATEDPEWRRVDLIVGSGEGQLVAAHEFGHVFGLDDEYSINPGGSISGTGNPVGTIVGHDAMARAIGTGGAVAENNDNIMSLGNMVQPQHYATFGWALTQLTGVSEWKVGPP